MPFQTTVKVIGTADKTIDSGRVCSSQLVERSVRLGAFDCLIFWKAAEGRNMIGSGVSWGCGWNF